MRARGDADLYGLLWPSGRLCLSVARIDSASPCRRVNARMLPGISSEDCLFADLGVDPGQNSCQSFEATDFLASRRRFDPSSELILWQVGVLGESSVKRGMSCRPERLKVLIAHLRRHYPAHHR